MKSFLDESVFYHNKKITTRFRRRASHIKIVRDPNVLASTASESPGKIRQESQNPLSPQAEKYDRTGRPVLYAYSSSYSAWNVLLNHGLLTGGNLMS